MTAAIATPTEELVAHMTAARSSTQGPDPTEFEIIQQLEAKTRDDAIRKAREKIGEQGDERTNVPGLDDIGLEVEEVLAQVSPADLNRATRYARDFAKSLCLEALEAAIDSAGRLLEKDPWLAEDVAVVETILDAHYWREPEWDLNLTFPEGLGDTLAEWAAHWRKIGATPMLPSTAQLREAFAGHRS